ncbi:MAG: transcriptional regulator [Gammaproteobacteria bacterium]|nr:MAG: transcriptional regulator [Gammaproteobacteria bacterium]
MNEAATTDRAAAVLRAHHLFKAIGETDFARLIQRVRPVMLAAGERLFHQGDPADRFFVIEHGRIKLSRLAPSGQEKVIEVMDDGMSFAEAVMFLGAPHYPVGAEALCASRLWAVPNRLYLEVLRKDPQTCLALLADLSIRLHARLREIDALSQQNAVHRLIRYLLDRIGPQASGRAEVDLDMPKQVLASRLSIKPESFSRLLAQLSQAGLISVHGRRIEIHDVAGLRAYPG